MKTTPLSTRILMLLVALGVAAYFGYQALRYLDDPLTTTMAYTYTVDKVIDVSGYVVRSERVLEDNPSGLLRPERRASGSAWEARWRRCTPIRPL